MTDEAFREHVRSLFQELYDRDAETRDRLLAAAPPAVRDEVRSLLASHDAPEPFIDDSIWDLIEADDGRSLAGTTVGPYRIESQLGRGGMGTVFLATRESDGFSQRVALKLVRGGESLVRRFRKERSILASLEHAGIARLLDGGTTQEGLPYLAMEYVDGIPIDDYCRSHALGLTAKLRLFLQLCDAVQHAHRALVIHRDLKPSNVLVTADGTAKLLDFGIAKLATTDADPDAPATRVMTPDYASPEQLRGLSVTTATDVYSLGVLLFEILTGRLPFDRAKRTADSEAPRPSSFSPESRLGSEIDAIVLAALEPDPARRYGSVENLAADIRRFLTGHPVAARQQTAAYRFRKFVRRNVFAVSAAAAVFLVTVVALVATLHQKRLAERRFEEVRSLANSVVFEIHDAIAVLPGSTPARALLVRRALVYLDNLARESNGNRALQNELARAYLKIGDVQGLPYSANLGDTAGAAASYRKALSIAESLTTASHDDASLTLLADACDRLGLVEQRAFRWIQALEQHERARSIRESLKRDARGELALARTWTAIGDCRYIGRGTIPSSMMRGTERQAYESALAVLARVESNEAIHREVLQEIGRAHQRLGGFYTGPAADQRLALFHHEAALHALEERARMTPDDAVAQRNFADQYVMTATAHNRFGNGAGALAAIDHALAVFVALADADPRNVEAQHDLAFAWSERGVALLLLARFDESEASLLRAVEIRRRLIAADPDNLEDRRDLKLVEGHLARLREERARH